MPLFFRINQVRGVTILNASQKRVDCTLDNELLNRTYDLMPDKKKKTVIETALIEFKQNRERKNLKDLRGMIKFENGYDYKALRKNGDELSLS